MPVIKLLTQRLRKPAALHEISRRASTGAMVVKDPLNFWGASRVKLNNAVTSEPVYEPATGKYSIRNSLICAIQLLNVSP